MKTKILYRLAVATAIAGIVFVSCSKSSSSATGSSSSDLQTQSDDQTRVSNETDAVADDANAAMSSQSSVSGASTQSIGYGQGKIVDGGQGVNVPGICDGTIVVDSTSNPRTITITYNGSACNITRTRTGVVVISIPAGVQWRDQGAVVTVSIQNLVITRLSDNKTLTLNGTHVYTNVSGGSLLGLALGAVQSITHTITADSMSVTFDNGAQRLWSVARQRVYTDTAQNITISTTGTHSDGTNSGISEWGTNRFGNSFVTEITTPLTLQSGCSFNLTSGQVEIVRPNLMTTVTFGLDAQGASTSCPGIGGTYYFEVVWTTAGKSYSFILPY